MEMDNAALVSFLLVLPTYTHVVNLDVPEVLLVHDGLLVLVEVFVEIGGSLYPRDVARVARVVLLNTEFPHVGTTVTKKLEPVVEKVFITLGQLSSDNLEQIHRHVIDVLKSVISLVYGDFPFQTLVRVGRLLEPFVVRHMVVEPLPLTQDKRFTV